MERNLEGITLRIGIGDYRITGGFEVKYQSEDATGPDWARAVLSDELAEFVKGQALDACLLEMGNEYGYETELQGPGVFLPNADHVLVIQSDAPGLAQMRVAATFLDCTLQEAARYIFGISGISRYVMTQADFGRKRVFTIDAMSCGEAIRELNTVFGCSLDLFTEDGVTYYGAAALQQGFYTLTDNNVLDLEKSGELWAAELIPLPGLRARQQINVACEEFRGCGQITKCVIEGGKEGIRMWIRFKEVQHGGY